MINYKNVEQNSDAWLNIRKNKITGSRLSALLGVYVKKKFESYWKIVKEGLNESDLFNKCFKNFRRGHQFEKEALVFFRNQPLSNATPCGFFTLTEDETYGSSPDALVAPNLLLEIKIRAENSKEPLSNLFKSPAYFIQTQLQMVCTQSTYCFLMSYHPESKTAKYFLIQKNNILWDVVKCLMDSIFSNTSISDRPHKEYKLFATLEKENLSRIPSFESIKPLHTHINKLIRKLPMISFSTLQL